jgi:hypothetical protein
MSTVPSTSTSTSQSPFVSIFNAALESYKRKTKKDLASHPLLPSLQICDSPEAVLTVLRDQVPAFNQSLNGDHGLTKWVTPTVNVLYSFSETIGQGVGLVNIKTFRRGGISALICLFTGIPTGRCSLCWDRGSTFGRFPASFCRATCFDTEGPQAAKDAGASRDQLIDIFNRVEHFFRRLEIYTSIKPTTSMTNMIVDIMVEVLTILAVATKETKRGRFSELMSFILPFPPDGCSEKYFMKLTGNRDIEDSLDKLDKLTQEEARMASAELLKMTHSVDGKLMGVDDRVRSVTVQVQDVRGDVEGVRGDVQDVRGDVQGIRGDVQDVRFDVQDVRVDVQDARGDLRDVGNMVQDVDDQLDQVNRSSSL